MSAFEELGVMPEVIRAIEEIGWLLPTPVQSESIPLILGGGDVCASAETGSGKTGAFAIPMLQSVHETRRDADRVLSEAAARVVAEAAERSSAGGGGGGARFAMSAVDRDATMAVAADGLCVQAREERSWAGCRAAFGLARAAGGRFYYEAVVEDEGLCRVGWATATASLDLGTDAGGYGFGGTGKKSNARSFETYGEAFGLGDVIGCSLDLDAGNISFSKNGVDFGTAFELGSGTEGSAAQALFPAVVLKNAQMGFNFGASPFKHGPPAGHVAFKDAPEDSLVRPDPAGPGGEGAKKAGGTAGGGGGSGGGGSGGGGGKKAMCEPLGMILEPSRELAEQTYDALVQFSKHMPDPAPRPVLLVGGVQPKPQIQALQAGCDIFVGTPGRVADFLKQGKLGLAKLRFFCLDEADRLLDTGNSEMIMKMYDSVSRDPTRPLQVLLFSATLHSPEIAGLTEQITRHATWVDLKGKDSVPETVHFATVTVDAAKDRAWETGTPRVETDGIHAGDKVSAGDDLTTPEAVSEHTKLLKAQKIREIIDTLDMDQSMIFTRTKVDADNLERFLVAAGGGSKFRPGQVSGKENRYSCVVLHGDRRIEERRANLDAFKSGAARFLICTDVAARGIDIAGLPYVVNMTLPDNVDDYFHRCGRVGRADALGLAISIVSSHPEKVWYHKCPSKGKKCTNAKTHDKGGCGLWIDERTTIAAIRSRIGISLEELGPGFKGKDTQVTYGTKRDSAGNEVYRSHAEQLKPTVKTLGLLEERAQLSFLRLQTMFQ